MRTATAAACSAAVPLAAQQPFYQGKTVTIIVGSPAGGGLDLSLVPAAVLDGVTVERGGDARLLGSPAELRHDDRREDAKDHEHEQQLDQREAARGATWDSGFWVLDSAF